MGLGPSRQLRIVRAQPRSVSTHAAAWGHCAFHVPKHSEQRPFLGRQGHPSRCPWGHAAVPCQACLPTALPCPCPRPLLGAAPFGLRFLTVGALQLAHCAVSCILLLVACVSPATWFPACQPAVLSPTAKRHVLPQDRVWFRCEKTGPPWRVSPRGPSLKRESGPPSAGSPVSLWCSLDVLTRTPTC